MLLDITFLSSDKQYYLWTVCYGFVFDPSRFLGGILDESSYCYTLEVSFYNYFNGLASNPITYTEESCILCMNSKLRKEEIIWY